MLNSRSHEACSVVIEIVSSGFKSLLVPSTDGITIVAIDNENPISHVFTNKAEEDRN